MNAHTHEDLEGCALRFGFSPTPELYQLKAARRITYRGQKQNNNQRRSVSSRRSVEPQHRVQRDEGTALCTDSRAVKRPALLYADLAGPMPVTSIGSNTSNTSVIIFAGHCSRFIGVKFLKNEDDTASALGSYIVGYNTPAWLEIRAFFTDIGGEFKGDS